MVGVSFWRRSKYDGSMTMNLATWGKAEVAKERVEVKPGIFFPIEITVKNFTSEVLQDLHLDAKIKWEAKTLGYALTEVTVYSPGVGRIQSADLHRLMVPQIISEISGRLMPKDVNEKIGLKDKEYYLALKKRPLSAELFKEVALRAAVGRALDYGKSNQYIMYAFDVSRRTASRWIAEAVGRGLLDFDESLSADGNN